MAKNIDVIEAFIVGRKDVKTKKLYVTGRRLYNYDTCIAEREESNGQTSFKVNKTKYSGATTAIQNNLIVLLSNDNVEYFDNVRIGASCLK